jgi:uncharacterized membrane protein YjgN (DUF898 family)
MTMPSSSPQGPRLPAHVPAGPVPQPYADAPSDIPSRAQTRQFAFDGGAATYFGTAVLGFLITVCSLGLCYPFALVLRERWRAKHSFIDGRQLVFNGSAWGLFGLWWKWFILIMITVGIYGFWVGPRVYRWRWEHTSWAQQIPARW